MLQGGESRALMMGLEKQYDLPTGSLQALGEQLTGWEAIPSLLPPHRERSKDRYQEHIQMAQRLREKLNEFDGVLPLAFDAYLRGDKQTRQAISGAGFDHQASQNVYRALERMPKYGAPEPTEEDKRVLKSVFGEPSPVSERTAKVPDAVRPSRLTRLENGKYYTGDTYMDAVMYIESRGNPNAVSPTGATGLFQFTRGTGKSYGLITRDGRDLRKDPELNFKAARQLTQDNASALQKAGIEVTPTNLYLAHQQGAGGAIEIIRAMKQGREVSPAIRKNMNYNNGRGKTPAQFYAFVDSKVKEAIRETKKYAPPDARFVEDIPTQDTYHIQNMTRHETPPKYDLGERASALAKLQEHFKIKEHYFDVPVEIKSAILGIIG